MEQIKNWFAPILCFILPNYTREDFLFEMHTPRRNLALHSLLFAFPSVRTRNIQLPEGPSCNGGAHYGTVRILRKGHRKHRAECHGAGVLFAPKRLNLVSRGPYKDRLARYNTPGPGPLPSCTYDPLYPGTDTGYLRAESCVVNLSQYLPARFFYSPPFGQGNKFEATRKKQSMVILELQRRVNDSSSASIMCHTVLWTIRCFVEPLTVYIF